MPTLEQLQATRLLAIEAAEATLENAKPTWEKAQADTHAALVAAGAVRDAGYTPFGDAYNAAKATAMVVQSVKEQKYLAARAARDTKVADAEQAYRDDVIAEQEAQRAAQP